MNRLTLFMARSPLTWYPFASTGMLVALVVLVLLDIPLRAARSVWETWHYDWRYEWAEMRAVFTEKHRRSLRSLALKPLPGGKVEHS